jgi:hypothetical protein
MILFTLSAHRRWCFWASRLTVTSQPDVIFLELET